MKKKLLLVTAAAFMAFGAIGYTGSHFLSNENPVVVRAAAANVTFGHADFTGQGISGGKSDGTSAISLTDGGVTVSCTNGYKNPDQAFAQLYANSTFTVTGAAGMTITKMQISCTANNASNYGPGKMSLASGQNGSYSYSGKVGTWTGSANNVSFTVSAQVRFTSIYVEFDDGQAGAKTLSISSPENYTKVGSQLTFTPSGSASMTNLTWNISPSNLATISNGVLTASSYGTVSVTAESSDGTVSEPVSITIYPNNVSEISIPLAREICDLAGSTASPYSYKLSAEVFDIGEGWSEQYGNITFDLWDDEANTITCFRAKGYSGIDVEDKIQVTGNLLKYNDIYEFASGCTYLKYHTVLFDNDGDQYGDDFEVLDGSTIAKPNDPVKSGYTFNGWLDEDDNLWDFDNNTVSDDMILTASWSSAAEASLQDELNAIDSWMSLSYKYTDTMVKKELNAFIDPEGNDISSNTSRNMDANATIELADDFGCDDELSIVLRNEADTKKPFYLTAAAIRLYPDESIIFSGLNGESVFEVYPVDENGNEITIPTLAVEYSSGSAVMSVTTKTNNIKGFHVVYGSGGLEDVDFRLRMATDNMDEFASSNSVTEYGIEVKAGTKVKSYAYNSETYVDESTQKQYVVIGLGDVFANPDRLTEKFTIRAYAVSGGKTFYSTKSKPLNVIDLVKTYHEMETTSELVEPLYNYLTTLGYID